MRIAPLADVKARLSAYLDQVEDQGPVVITRNGRPVALLLAPHDQEDLERLILTHSARFQKILARSRRNLRGGRALSGPEFWSQVRRAKNPRCH